MDKCVDGSTFREVHNCFQDFLTHSWEADRWLNIFPYTFFLKCIGKTLVNGQIIIWWSGNGHEPSLKLERRCVDRWSCSRWFISIERTPPGGEGSFDQSAHRERQCADRSTWETTRRCINVHTLTCRWINSSPLCPQKSPVYPQKNPVYLSKGPVYLRKSPVYPWKSPVYLQKSPEYPQKRCFNLHTPMDQLAHILSNKQTNK